MIHKTRVVQVGVEWAGRCSCKARGEAGSLRSEAEDWGAWHLREVQRARAHLSGRAPSLRDQYDYYRRMQDDPDTPPGDRAQWKVLADGLEHRLGLTETTPSMFEETG